MAYTSNSFIWLNSMPVEPDMERGNMCSQGSSKDGDLDHASRSYIILFLSVWAFVGQETVICHTNSNDIRLWMVCRLSKNDGAQWLITGARRDEVGTSPVPALIQRGLPRADLALRC